MPNIFIEYDSGIISVEIDKFTHTAINSIKLYVNECNNMQEIINKLKEG